MGGQSGAPVINRATNKIIGVHTGGGYNENNGTALNNEIMRWLSPNL